MKTTAEDFAAFQGEATRWLGALGLTDYDVSFLHEPIADETWAQVDSRYRAHTAIITLNTDVNSCCREDMRDLAVHEVFECLLTELDDLAASRKWSAAEWESARHRVINRLVNFVKRTEYWKQPQPTKEA